MGIIITIIATTSRIIILFGEGVVVGSEENSDAIWR
jgi:hypothetical protein